jgi:hypothetical protein
MFLFLPVLLWMLYALVENAIVVNCCVFDCYENKKRASLEIVVIADASWLSWRSVGK